MDAQFSAEAEADGALGIGADQIEGINGGGDAIDGRKKSGEAGSENDG
jgi:hypothetical protein